MAVAVEVKKNSSSSTAAMMKEEEMATKEKEEESNKMKITNGIGNININNILDI